jgi:photosystem II stability/assembly factor-like uncharacterized protein
MLDPNVWMIGDNLGNLWYTEDGGATWFENTDIDQTLTVIDEIEFFDETVGYMSARISAQDGRIFRTIDGGMTWYELPEGTTGQLAENDRINSLAVCKDPNIVWGAGLNADGTTGFMAKAS